MLSTGHMTQVQGQGHWRWNKIVQVNGAHKRGRYDQIGLKSLHIMSNVKAFVM